MQKDVQMRGMCRVDLVGRMDGADGDADGGC